MKHTYSKSIEKIEAAIKNASNLKTLSTYFKNKEFVYLFTSQISVLKMNIKSIEILLDSDLFEDSMTIFRKYLETYLTMSSLIKNPLLVDQYLRHNRWLGERACGENKQEINHILKSKPQGFLEYGFLSPLDNITNRNGIYTVRSLAKASSLLSYYDWYRKSSNFVHNNLSSTVYNPEDGKESLTKWLKRSISTLETNLSAIRIIL